MNVDERGVSRFAGPTNVFGPEMAAVATILVTLPLLDLIVGQFFLAHWPVGYFLSMNLAVGSTALVMERRFVRSEGLAQRVLSVIVLALAQIVLVETALGLAGRLTVAHTAITCTLLFWLAMAVWGPAWGPKPLARLSDATALARSLLADRWFVLCVAVALFAAAEVLYAGWLKPPSTGDALTYHLTLAVEWYQRGDLATPLIATGDPSVTYFPLNVSLFYLWLFLPFGDDVMARAGPVLFVAMAALACYRLARQLGLSRRWALLATGLVALMPDVLRSAFVAEADVAFAALLLTALTDLLDWVDDARPARMAMGATSLGLLLGTKYLAVPYVAMLGMAYVAIAVVRIRQSHPAISPASATRDLALLAAGCLLLGGTAYARNWLLTGNPLYPGAVRALGREILPGLFTLSADFYRFSVYNPFSPTDFILGVGQFGWQLPLFALPGAALAVAAVLTRWRSPTTGVEKKLLLSLCVLPASFTIFWLVSPYHFNRFLYFHAALLTVVAARGWATALRRPGPVWRVFVVALFVSSALLVPRYTPWASPPYLLAAGVAVGLLFGAGLLADRLSSSRRMGGWLSSRRLPAATLVSLALILTVGLARFAPLYRSGKYTRWLRLDEGGTAYAWQWLDAVTSGHPATIAYAGDNKPYPLYGRRFANRVLYVPPDEREPVFGLGHPAISQPRRLIGEQWLARLRVYGVAYLFIAQDPITGVFPQEEAWAQADPQSFSLAFERARVRVYRVSVVSRPSRKLPAVLD